MINKSKQTVCFAERMDTKFGLLYITEERNTVLKVSLKVRSDSMYVSCLLAYLMHKLTCINYINHNVHVVYLEK